jgi:hypothetical protein
MKKTALIVSALIVFTNLARGQGNKEIFDPKTKLTWLGLDFSAARFMGDREKLNAETLQKLMESWNKLMINEADKYDVGKALHRSPLEFSLTHAIDHNDQLNLQNVVDDGAKLLRLNKSDISQIISSYDFGTETGIGLIFVVESFSKLEKRGVIWVTFVNMGSKEVIFTDRLTGKPGGFGLRNYWAGAIAQILNQVKSNYSKWKKG